MCVGGSGGAWWEGWRCVGRSVVCGRDWRCVVGGVKVCGRDKVCGGREGWCVDGAGEQTIQSSLVDPLHGRARCDSLNR